MGNVIILGSQWGDEGKGKIVDLFAERFDIVARYQGGHNAGHTVFIGDKKFVLKLIPSGILRPGKQAVIGNGLVIDPAALLSEIASLQSAGVAVTANLFISNRAHVLFPAHRMMEKMSEGREGRVSIGTTSRGIGPCYEDKIARRGIRIADLLDTEFFRAQYDSVMEEKVLIARALGIQSELDLPAADAACAWWTNPRPSPASWKRRARNRPPPSATTPYSWSATCAAPNTSKFRFWATGDRKSCTSTSAIAPCSGDIRRWSRWRPPCRWRPISASNWPMPPPLAPAPPRAATA